MSHSSRINTRRPSSTLYGKIAELNKTGPILEKDGHSKSEFIENADEAFQGMDDSGTPGCTPRNRLILPWERWVWALVTVGLSLLCLVLSLQLVKAKNSPGVYKATDLASARVAIVEERQSFHTTAKILDSGVVTFSTADLKYVGPPSREIDDAWVDLIQPQILALSDEEAGEMKKLSIKNSNGKRIMSLYLYHALHCLNMLRKSFDFDYYYKNNSESTGDNYRDHIYHCIDDLRQNILCQGDLTPVPFYWDTHMEWPIGNTTQLHTCRNHQAIREWAMERRVGHGGQPIGLPINMDGHGHK